MGTNDRAEPPPRRSVTTAAPPSTHGSPARPLVVTSDTALLDELLPLAAAGCGDVDVACDAIAARPYWGRAPLVVIGADAATGCVQARLPHRRDVVLVATLVAGEADDASWQAAGALGADHVVVLPAAAPWLAERFGGATTLRRGEAPVVGVVGGRGGAGASILAAALAVTGSRAGQRVMLVDADPLGGGMDLLLGWETAEGLRWPELAAAKGRVDVDALHAELPRSGELVVVSWDRGDTFQLPVTAMDATLDAGQRGNDLVIVDLPRHLDDAAVRAAQLTDQVLLVVPADVRGCAAAARVVGQLGPHCGQLRIVVRGPAPGRLRVSDVSGALGLPVAGSLRPEPGLDERLELAELPVGTGKGPLADLCTGLLADLPRAAESRDAA